MPNTLAHLGVAGLATRSIITAADLKWVYIGAVIPDLPWILQRFARIIIPGIDLYDLRLYVIIQSTFLFGIILSLALSSLSTEYKKTFLILSLGCLIHLLLDSLQIKWANGVILLAPFTWEPFGLSLFWPESLPTYIITLFGLFYFITLFKKGVNVSFNLAIGNLKRWGIFICVMVIYILLPLLMLNPAYEADNHYVKTLHSIDERSGKYFEVDRRPYTYENGRSELSLFSGEKIKLKNINLKTDEIISVRARFVDLKSAEVIEYHVHSVLFRDGSSYLGLTFILIFWGYSFSRRIKTALP